MSEKISEFYNLRKIVHRIYCDECNIELQTTGRVYTINPPIYEYICPQCRKKYEYRTTYPWSEIIGDEVICDDQGRKVCMSL